MSFTRSLPRTFVTLLVAIWLLTPLLIKAQNTRETTSEWVLWPNVGETILWKDHWSASFAGQYRRFIDREEGFHIFLQGGINYLLADGFSVGAGFINLNINDVFDGNELLLSELRPYQSLQLNYPAGKVKFNWRLMIEERFLRTTANGERLPGHEYVWRFRNKFMFLFPLGDDFSIETSSEVMIHAGGSIIFNDFDQHRAIFQLHYSMGPFQLSTGYMHWLLQTFGGVLQNRHTWLMGVKHRIDLRQKP